MTDAAQRESRDILSESPPRPADERIAYGPEPLQFADLRLPSSPGPWPLAIVLHGGGWQANFNLTHAGHLCMALGARGIATWNVEYRRVGDPGGGWPGSFEDVLRAIEYSRDLPGATGTEAVLVGHSAGGHLALLAAVETRLPVVAIAAATDFDSWENEPARAFLGDADRDIVSPRRRLPLGVRQVLIHGTDDDQVPFSLSEGYVEAARAAGDDADLVALQGDGHFEPVDPKSSSWPRVEDVIQRAVRARGRH